VRRVSNRPGIGDTISGQPAYILFGFFTRHWATRNKKNGLRLKLTKIAIGIH